MKKLYLFLALLLVSCIPSAPQEPLIDGKPHKYVSLIENEGYKSYVDLNTIQHPPKTDDSIRSAAMKVDFNQPKGPKSTPYNHQIELTLFNCSDGTFFGFDDKYYNDQWKLIHESPDPNIDFEPIGNPLGVAIFNIVCKDVPGAIILDKNSIEEEKDSSPSSNNQTQSDRKFVKGWAQLFQTDDIFVEISPDSIKPGPEGSPPTIRSFMVRTKFKNVGIVDGKTEFNGLISGYILDCKTDMATGVVGMFFMDKIEVAMKTYDAPHWIHVEPDSIVDHAKDVVCAGVNLGDNS